MRQRWSTLITVLVTAGSVPALTYAETSAPRGVVADDTYNFGSVRQGSLVSHAFTIKNTGAAPLRITGATLSIRGMNLRVAPAEVLPEGGGTVSVELSTGSMAGEVDGEAQIHWNDPTRPVVILKLKGYVTPPIAIEPVPAIFMSAFSDEPAERSLTIRNNEARPLAISKVEHSQHLTVSVANLEPGKLFVLTARSAKGAPVGRFEESLTLVTDKPGASRIDLPVHLWVKPDLYANPETIEFGNVRIQDVERPDIAAPLTQTFFVKHSSGAFEITSIDCDFAAVAVTQSPAGPSDSFQINVRLRPDALSLGNINGKIRVTTTVPRYPELVIPLTGAII